MDHLLDEALTLVAGDGEASLGDEPIDQALDPLVDFVVLGVEESLERTDHFTLEAETDLANEVFSAGCRSRAHEAAWHGRSHIRRPYRDRQAPGAIAVGGDRDRRDRDSDGVGREGRCGRFGDSFRRLRRGRAVRGCLGSLFRLLGALHALKQRHDLDFPLIAAQGSCYPVSEPALRVLAKSSPFFLPAGLRPRTSGANSVPGCHPSGLARTRHHRR